MDKCEKCGLDFSWCCCAWEGTEIDPIVNLRKEYDEWLSRFQDAKTNIEKAELIEELNLKRLRE